MIVLGIHDGHNASVCLLQDGEIKAAIQEERLTRVKNINIFPYLSIKEILKITNTSISDIDLIAMHSKHMPYHKTKERMLQEYKGSQSFKTSLRRILKSTPANTIFRERRRQNRNQELAKAGFLDTPVVYVEHHMAHAAAGYFGSPWHNEKVLVLTNDGSGDDMCATVKIAENCTIKRIASVNEEHSLGHVYAKITFLLGMVPNEHEYKLMGLAPYAKIDKTTSVYKKLNSILKFNDDGLTWSKQRGVPHTYYSYNFFKNLLELDRFDCIAGGLQKFTEEFLAQWICNAIKTTGIRKVALSGGVFMNVKANKKISELPEVEDIFIFPSCGDESNSIGAAYWAYAEKLKKQDKNVDIKPLGPIYFGPEYSDEDTEKAFREFHMKNIEIRKYSDIEKKVAELLSRGKIVGRFKGKMEFGARALGNRSILAHPQNPEVLKIINEIIKARDFWMPFAPSILEERADEYILNSKKLQAPYMIMSFNTTDQVGQIKAAVHPYDLTVRPQIVKNSWNPKYYNLIKEFERLTGIGAVLNTSFNLHGYPIVCTPKDALQVFSKSGLKYLAIGNFLVSKTI